MTWNGMMVYYRKHNPNDYDIKFTFKYKKKVIVYSIGYNTSNYNFVLNIVKAKCLINSGTRSLIYS